MNNRLELSWQGNRPFSKRFNDGFYADENGRAESQYIFLQANQIAQRIKRNRHFCIVEAGFGCGINFLNTLALIDAQALSGVHYVTIEKYPLTYELIERALSNWPDLISLFQQNFSPIALPPATLGWHEIPLQTSLARRCRLSFFHGDIADFIDQAPPSLNRIDCFYLDGFSPKYNKSMWTPQLFEFMAARGVTAATVSSYSVAGSVRRGLAKAGFTIQRLPGYGRKRQMLFAKLNQRVISRNARRHPKTKVPNTLELPLSQPSYYTNKRLAVIGAGLSGMAAAWSFAERQWQVSLFDRIGIAAEASGCPKMAVYPKLSEQENDFQLVSSIYTLAWLNQVLASAEGQYWQNCVVRETIRDKSELQRLKRLCDRFAGLIEFEPVMKQSVAEQGAKFGSVVHRYGAWVDPNAMLNDLKIKLKIELTKASISAAHFDGQKWQLKDNQGRFYGDFDAVVIANSHGFSTLEVSTVAGDQSLMSLLAQMMPTQITEGIAWISEAAFAQDDIKIATDITFPVDKNTQVQIKGRQGFDQQIKADRQRLQEFRAWRQHSRDHMPVIGPLFDYDHCLARFRRLRLNANAIFETEIPCTKGLFLSICHGSHALSTAFLAAEILANYAENLPLPVNQLQFSEIHPARFLFRKLRRNQI